MPRFTLPIGTALLACMLWAPRLLAAGDGVDGHAAIGVQQPAQESLPSLSQQFGIEFIPAPEHLLPPQDNEYFLEEDILLGNGSGPNPLRFAIPTPAALDIGSGEWIHLDGGRLWRTVISAPNATTARLHLKGIDLSAGQQLRMSAPGWADSVIGPIEGKGEFGTGEVWSLSLPTAKVLLEWFVPDGTVAKELPFTEADYYHGYRQIWKIDEGGAEGGVAVGSCHLDPICFSTWSNESNGTIRLIFSGSLCSGQLTATTATDETPYVTTANHCISTQSTANSCQFNFFYRRNTCAASATAAAGSNVTGGDLVVTHSASDCTLLMIRPTLPANVGWVGWTNNNVSTSTASTCLHHPDASYQRISFGTKNASSFPCGSPQSNWSSLSWNSATQYGVTSTGVTEVGSSGSAIYRNSDRRMYGVLTCGGSSCSSTSPDDGYGRIDVAISSGGFATPLAAGTDDTREPNDSCAAANALTNGTYTSLVVKRVDQDWYLISSAPGTGVSISATYTHANGDIDLELFSACGGTAIASDLGNVNNASINYTNTSGSSQLFLCVYLNSDTRNEYTLTLSSSGSPPPANDECAAAITINSGNTTFNTSTATNSAFALPTTCTANGDGLIVKDIWYKFVAPCSGRTTVSTCGLAAFNTRLAVYGPSTACPGTSTPVNACNDDGAGCASGTSSLSFVSLIGSTYYFRVGGATAGGSGTLAVACSDCAADLNNDLYTDAEDLAVLLANWNNSGQGDLDNSGIVDGADLAEVLGAWGACP